MLDDKACTLHSSKPEKTGRFRSDWGPLEYAANASQPCALTIVQHVEGPSYRPVGALMTVRSEGGRIGSLSSGCVEADIEHHALVAMEKGETTTVRYGRGSPFMDIVLPCGGGLEILIVPYPDQAVLRSAVKRLKQRHPVTIKICSSTGQMSIVKEEVTGVRDTHFCLHLVPELRFLVFGKGPETADFAALTWASGYEVQVYSPDPETLGACSFLEESAVELRAKHVPANVTGDGRTAAVLFFHDHDWEPGLLRDLVRMDLYYIGAQGSMNAKAKRDQTLQELEVQPDEIARIHGPIGLVPSARDSRTLAISVLSELIALVP